MRLIFIDEFSFLSQSQLSAISRRCQQASRNNTRPFGDFHVVLVGDPRQHEAPKSSPLIRGAAAQRRIAQAVGAGGGLLAPAPSQPEPDAVDEDEEDRVSAGALRAAERRRASDADGRHAFTSCLRVVYLTEQQRANDTDAGHTLRRYASLFMGNSRASLADVEEFCEAFNAKAVTDISDMLPSMPRVVSQRQKARSAINLNLALRVASALGKRASVWLSTHANSDGPCPDAIARQIRKQVNVNKADKLPATLVFFEVRSTTRRYLRLAPMPRLDRAVLNASGTQSPRRRPTATCRARCSCSPIR